MEVAAIGADGTGLIAGNILIVSHTAYALYDTSTTYSFITPEVTRETRMPILISSQGLSVKTPTGNVIITKELIKDCPLQIQGHTTNTDLIVMKMNKYGIILGMNWMNTVNVMIDCRRKRVIFQVANGSLVTYDRELVIPGQKEISSFELIVSNEPCL